MKVQSHFTSRDVVLYFNTTSWDLMLIRRQQQQHGSLEQAQREAHRHPSEWASPRRGRCFFPAAMAIWKIW